MIPNGLPGVFIVFEGMDGCGKSIQCDLFLKWMDEHRQWWVEIVKTKEPGKKRFWGNRIYQELPKPVGIHTLNPLGFQKWYALDSLENLKTNIIPGLKAGNIVLADRFRPSMVYGAKSPAEIPALMHLNEIIIAGNFIWPDIIFIFDVPIEVAIQRLSQKGRPVDEYEKGPVLERVRRNYRAFCGFYENCEFIDANKPPEEIFETVKTLAIPVLENKRMISKDP